MVDAGEHVEQRPLGGRGEPHAAGGDHRHAERRGQGDERLVVGLLVATVVTLQLDVGTGRGRRCRPADRADRRRRSAARRARRGRQAPRAHRVIPSRSSSVSAPSPFGERSFMRVTSRQRLRYPSADSQSTGSRTGRRSRLLAPAPRRPRSTVSSAPTIGLMPGRERRLVKPRRAVDAVAIEKRERRIAEVGGTVDERFGQRRALKKTESRGRVQFDIGGHGGQSFDAFTGVQSTIASTNHPPVTRSLKIRYTAPSPSTTSHSSHPNVGPHPHA